MMTAHVLPNLVIAGAPRCGTTSLFDYLSRHPEVCPATEKETRFLIDPSYSLFVPGRSVLTQGLDGYSQFFPTYDRDRHRITLEATPDYLYQRTALDTLAAMPNTTVLFIFRQPSRRILSLYNFAKHVVGAIDADITFGDFIASVRAGRIPSTSPILRGAIDHTNYAHHLQPWVDRLPRERLWFCLFEHLAEDPVRFMTQLAVDLGISPGHYTSRSLDARNRSVRVRSRRLQAVRSRYGPLVARTPVLQRARPALRRVYEAMQHRVTTDELTDDDRRVLRDLEMQHVAANQQLGSMTGLDVSRWMEPVS